MGKTITAAGTPERISTTDIFCTSVLIEAATANTGNMYVATTEALASSVNRHVLAATDTLAAQIDRWADLDQVINLKDLWFDGATTGERLVVTYMPVSRDYSRGTA